jgi:hypothetical protein
MAEASIPAALIECVAALWRIPAPGLNNLLTAPEFVRLRDTCASLYLRAGSKEALGFALSTALRALGLPCALAASNTHLGLSVENAAAQLDAAFRRTHATRLYLCPLDMAGELPALKFGPNTIRRFTLGELEALVDAARLERINPNWIFDAKRFSQFNWLVVEQMIALDGRPGAHAIPLFFKEFEWGQDWGQIEPHRERFPTAVEAALFAIVLAPWEDWLDMPEIEWCDFRVPWVYRLDNDIFRSPAPPPSPDTLSWEPDSLVDWDGEEGEVERPWRLALNNGVAVAPDWLSDDAWSALAYARKSPLFETPIAHFLVRGFVTTEMDEILAHITTIEAALGLQSDYRGKGGATKRMAKRVAALLGAAADGQDFERLFNFRSAFLHGRAMGAIPGRDRLLARRLARRVVNALVKAALTTPLLSSRAAYLDSLI